MFSPNQNNNQRGYVYTLNVNYDGDKTLAPPPPPDPKQTIRFDVKSDEELVYNSGYKFNRDIEILISNSKRGARKVTPPRRQNAWIIYRKDKSKLPEFRGKHSSEVSVKIREMWNKESKEVREIYTALSNLAEKKHIEKYGKDYKYKPDPLKKTNKKQKKEPKTPRKKKVQTCETGHFMINFIDFSTPTSSPNTNETITHRPPHPPHPPNPPNINNFQTATFNFPQIELNNNKPNEFIWQEHFMLNQFPLIDDIDDMNEEVDSVYELFSEKSPKQYIYYDL